MFFGLTKHVACCVSISIATYNLYINKHHFRRDKSKQFFSRKDSGHVQIKNCVFGSGLVFEIRRVTTVSFLFLRLKRHRRHPSPCLRIFLSLAMLPNCCYGAPPPATRWVLGRAASVRTGPSFYDQRPRHIDPSFRCRGEKGAVGKSPRPSLATLWTLCECPLAT
jgi:hypothetical protein